MKIMWLFYVPQPSWYLVILQFKMKDKKMLAREVTAYVIATDSIDE